MIIAIEFMSLDGVIQSPGGKDEDTSGNFKSGGWISGYPDPSLSSQIKEEMDMEFDLLLGRKTFEIWAGYWPDHPDIWPNVNKAVKYVVSGSVSSGNWENSVFMGGEAAEKIRELKKQTGPNLHVYGSSVLVQTLLENDLLDELWLKIYPVVLGEGKKLFGESGISTAYEITKSRITPDGVILANYRKK